MKSDTQNCEDDEWNLCCPSEHCCFAGVGAAKHDFPAEVLNWLHARLFVYATWWQMFLQLDNLWFHGFSETRDTGFLALEDAASENQFSRCVPQISFKIPKGRFN